MGLFIEIKDAGTPATPTFADENNASGLIRVLIAVVIVIVNILLSTPHRAFQG